MRKLLGISVLTVILACSTRAGVIPNGVIDQPPPQPPVEEVKDEANGPEEPSTPYDEIALTLLSGLLSLL